MGNRSRRSTMAIAILCILGVLSVAYAAFSTNLTINLTGDSKNNWNILFDSGENNANIGTYTVNPIKTTDDSPSCGEITFENNYTYMRVKKFKLSTVEDILYYVVPVSNKGNIDGYFWGDFNSNVLIEEITTSTNSTYALNREIRKTSTKPENVGSCENLFKEEDEDNFIKQGDILGAGKTIYWVIKVYFPSHEDKGNIVFSKDLNFELPCTWFNKEKYNAMLG